MTPPTAVFTTAREFARENRRVVLARARLGVLIGAIVLVLFVPVDLLHLPDDFATVTTIRFVGATLLLASLALVRRWRGDAHAIGLTAWGVTVLAATDAGIMLFSADSADPAYFFQVVGMIFLVFGTSLIVPLDGLQMFTIGAVPLVLHAAASARFGVEANLPFLFATFVAVMIAAIGSQASHLARLAEYERRAAKEEVLRMHADFVAMVSHDIRNPLNVIQGYAALLRESPALDAEARDYVRRLESSANTALVLASNVLLAARLDDQPLELRREPVLLAELLDRVLGGQRLFYDAKNVGLDVDVDRDLPAMSLDPGEIERVFTNLLSNALQFSRRGKRVSLTARSAERGWVEIRVEDQGDGIPPGAEQAIFARFGHTARRKGSTGLGLYIARSIVDAHGGTILAENRSDGPGARLLVRLPATTPLPGRA